MIMDTWHSFCSLCKNALLEIAWRIADLKNLCSEPWTIWLKAYFLFSSKPKFSLFSQPCLSEKNHDRDMINCFVLSKIALFAWFLSSFRKQIISSFFKDFGPGNLLVTFFKSCCYFISIIWFFHTLLFSYFSLPVTRGSDSWYFWKTDYSQLSCWWNW